MAGSRVTLWRCAQLSEISRRPGAGARPRPRSSPDARPTASALGKSHRASAHFESGQAVSVGQVQVTRAKGSPPASPARLRSAPVRSDRETPPSAVVGRPPHNWLKSVLTSVMLAVGDLPDRGLRRDRRRSRGPRAGARQRSARHRFRPNELIGRPSRASDADSCARSRRIPPGGPGPEQPLAEAGRGRGAPSWGVGGEARGGFITVAAARAHRHSAALASSARAAISAAAGLAGTWAAARQLCASAPLGEARRERGPPRLLPSKPVSSP